MKTYVEVTGSGAATGAPDRIDLSVTLTAVRPGVAAALAQVDGLVSELGEALRASGVESTDLRTTSSSVHEEYAGPDNARAGYRANHDLTVRITNLDSLAEVFAAAVRAVGDDFRLNQLSWGIADESDLISRAREAAFSDARAKAEELAALAGRSVGKLLRITETTGGYGPAPRFALAKSDAGFAPERGTSQVDVAVTARWALG